MVKFEFPRVIHPLVSFNFGVNTGLPFSLDAGKGKCCMWPAKNVEIPFAKIGFVDCKWSNLNAPVPVSYIFLASFNFGVNSGLPFSLDAGKGKCCMWFVKSV